MSVAGYTLREWSLFILLFILGIATSVFVIGLAIAVINNPNITFKGEIDLSQFTGIIIGIAMTAVTLVGMQLGAKNVASAVKQTDETWLAEK